MSRTKAPSAMLVTFLALAFALPLQSRGTPAGRMQPGTPDQQSHFEPLPNFDARELRVPGKQRLKLDNRKPALAVRSRIDEVVLTWDDRLDLPHSVLSLNEPLTAGSNDDSNLIAKRFVHDNSSLFAISDSQLDSARISARETDGFTRLVLEQQSRGIRVFDSEMLFIIDREGRVRSESGSFIPQIEKLA